MIQSMTVCTADGKQKSRPATTKGLAVLQIRVRNPRSNPLSIVCDMGSRHMLSKLQAYTLVRVSEGLGIAINRIGIAISARIQ